MSTRKPIEKEIRKSDGIIDAIIKKYRDAPLKEQVYFHKILMAIMSAIACSIVAIIQMYTHVNFNVTFFAQSISVGCCWLGYLFYFILAFKAWHYDEKLGGKSKILMEGVGAFIFIWLFIWTIVNTIAWVIFYGVP